MKFLYILEQNNRLSAHIKKILESKAEQVEEFILPEQVHRDTFNVLDEDTRRALAERIVKRDYDLVFSMGYFHEVSVFCEMVQKVYLSWIVELPNPDMFRAGIKNSCNCFFVADTYWCEWLQAHGAGQCFYLPAAAYSCERQQNFYEYEVGYIGRYPEMPEKSAFHHLLQVSLPCKGYLDGLVHTQRVLYNREIVSRAIPNRVTRELSVRNPLSVPEDLVISTAELYTWFEVFPQVMRQEQELLFRAFPVEVAVFNGQPQTEKTDYAVYPYPKEEEIPELVSKTGMNIHTPNRYYIHGMAPLAFEILGHCGFLMAPGQQDMQELFEEGKDFVLFKDGFHLREQVKEYRDKYEERDEIAQRAYEKIRESHTYDKRIDALLKML